MESIGQYLKSIRESKDLSLNEIAEATRINIKLLQEIENGTIQNLPATYIQAFIKEYAYHLGIDYEDLLKAKTSDGVDSKTSILTIDENQSLKCQFKKSRHSLVLLSVLLISIIGFTISIVFHYEQQSHSPVQEISFEDVQKEWEQKYQKSAEVNNPFADTTSNDINKDSSVVKLKEHATSLTIPTDKDR